MPNLIWIWDGTDATHGTQFFSTLTTATNATIGSDTDPDDSSRRVLRLTNGSTPTTGFPHVRRSGVLNDAGRRISILMSVSAVGTGSTGYGIFGCGSGGWFLRIRNTGALVLSAPGATLTVTSSLTIPTNQKFRLCIAYQITSTSDFTIKVYVDGVEYISATGSDGTVPTTGETELRLGVITSPTQWPANATVDYKNCVIDDGGPADGDMVIEGVTAKLPGTVNVNGYDTTIGTGAVNERPLAEANGKQHAGTSAAEQTYNIQAASAGDVDLTGKTIIGYTGWKWAKKGSGAGSPVDNLSLNGNNYPVTLTTTSALYSQVVTSDTYPTNAKGIGAHRTTGADPDAFLYECGVLVAYAPAAASGELSLALSDSLDNWNDTHNLALVHRLEIDDALSLTDALDLALGGGGIPIEGEIKVRIG